MARSEVEHARRSSSGALGLGFEGPLVTEQVQKPEPLEPSGVSGGRWRVLVGVPLAILGVGTLLDGEVNFAIMRGAPSVELWLGAVAALGSLYLLGEWAADRIAAQDDTNDPLPRRVLHLAAMGALWATLTLSALFVLRLAL